VQPVIYFGKGLGALPDWLSFAVIGAVDEIPTGTASAVLVPNLPIGRLESVFVPHIETLRWAFSFNTAPVI